MTDEERKVKVDDAYNQAMQLATEKPIYQGTYDQQINDLYGQISNRAPFSYDLQGDPLYQQMKDRYIQGGKMAMRDTMGKAASLTGGYGSSYGQAVGQQQYDAYLQDLSAQIPELYQTAYGMYMDEGDKLKDQYGMLRDLGDQEYGRYQDQLANWKYDNDRAYGIYQDAYNRVLNEENTAYQREQEQAKNDFSRQQQLYNNMYTLILKSGYMPSDDELAAAGMSRAQAEALVAEYQRGIAPKSSGGGGSSGSGSGSGSGNGSGGGNASASGDYTINSDELSAALNSGKYSPSAINQWISGASNFNGSGLSFGDTDYKLEKDQKGTYKYNSEISSKAASAAINKVLASLKK